MGGCCARAASGQAAAALARVKMNSAISSHRNGIAQMRSLTRRSSATSSSRISRGAVARTPGRELKLVAGVLGNIDRIESDRNSRGSMQIGVDQR
jgi:hypothetical protein